MAFVVSLCVGTGRRNVNLIQTTNRVNRIGYTVSLGSRSAVLRQRQIVHTPSTRWRMSTAPSSPSPSSPSPVSVLKPALLTFGSLGLLVGTDKLLAILLASMKITFPSALFGMLSIFFLLITLDVLRPQAAAGIVSAYKPGVDFITRWLAVCFAPSLVVLPLAPMPASADLLRTVIVLLFGWLSSTLLIAGFALTLQRLSGGGKEDMPVSPPAPQAPPSIQLIQLLSGAMVVSLGVSVATKCNPIAVMIYTLCATLLGFSVGNLFPAGLKKVCHPLITCAATALGAISSLAELSGYQFRTLLAQYVTRTTVLGVMGGGDVLMAFLGPAVVSFAFQMYARKRLMQQRSLEVFGCSLLASVTGLFGTAYLARLLGTSEYVRLFLIPRQLTAPLAIRVAEILGADVGLCLSAVVITGLIGANFSRAILDAFKVRDPAARGLSTGCSAHGLGTAALAPEPDAFAFSAIAMALVGLISTLLVCVPPVRILLLRIALKR